MKEQLQNIQTVTGLIEFLFFEKGLNVTEAAVALYNLTTDTQLEATASGNLSVAAVNNKIQGFERLVLHFAGMENNCLKGIVFGGFSNPAAIEELVNCRFIHVRTIDQSARDNSYTLEWESVAPGNFSSLIIETRNNAVKNSKLYLDGEDICGVSLVV